MIEVEIRAKVQDFESIKLNLIAPGAILEPKKYSDLMQEIINEKNK